ncbi:ParB/RepB/Spo0J family partition protein [Hydromonas duriensis]|uniref:ParB family chromosome partitioning protein n=1 Tax=Hydromonas duriensis TaxID=1527608 RepID=A0A4R6Y1Y4_9BURK|nr:ParB N-terminal domain-containing protein [Hydromonas duriensis]TDR30235.1 ParB family chromosome partitioning protein [Hydromonas duriensis]
MSKGKGIYDQLLKKTENIKPREQEITKEHRAPKSAPVMFMQGVQRIEAAEDQVDELRKQLTLIQSSHGICLDIPLTQLVEIKGRRRNLSAIEFEELKANLANNDLVTPITVRRVGADNYEIISGHNRVAAFKELNRESILAFVATTDENIAEINAFYANLFQPALPDYEKYIGFCVIQAQNKGISHDKLADLSGLSRSQVTKIMSFSHLPIQVHAMLEKNVSLLGANAALELSAFVKNGHAEIVTDAISKLANGEFDQKQAIKFVKSSLKIADNSASENTEEQNVVKNGDVTYCTIHMKRRKSIQIDFTSEDLASRAQKLITDFLNEQLK